MVISFPLKQWFVYTVNLNPRIGTKPGKQRPCLVIQPNVVNNAGHTSTVVLPVTTKLVGESAYPLRVGVKKGIAGLGQDSEIMIDQILTWDNYLFKKELGLLPETLQMKIRTAIKVFLEL